MNYIDVVMPTYNGAFFLAASIESVIKASAKNNTRLIIIDDCSTDESVSISESYENKYPEIITLLRSDRNHGAPYQRMRGVRHSSAEYICFIDQDDIWPEDRLSNLVTHCAKEDLDILTANIEFIDVHGRKKLGLADRENYSRRNIRLTGDSAIDSQMLFKFCPIRIGATIIKRQVFNEIQDFDQNLFGGEDWKFFVGACAGGAKIGYLDSIVTLRRQHDKNTSTTFKLARSKGLVDTALGLVEDYAVLRPLVGKVLLLIAVRGMLSFFEKGEFGNARELYEYARNTGKLNMTYLMVLRVLILFPHIGLLSRHLKRNIQRVIWARSN